MLARDTFYHTLMAALEVIASGAMPWCCAARRGCKACWPVWHFAHVLTTALCADTPGTMPGYGGARPKQLQALLALIAHADGSTGSDHVRNDGRVPHCTGEM